MDYIFVIGPSAAGKTTLAKGLYRHYHGVFLEQNMVPEFMIPGKTVKLENFPINKTERSIGLV